MPRRALCQISVFVLALFLFLNPLTAWSQRATSPRRSQSSQRNKATTQRSKISQDTNASTGIGVNNEPPPMPPPALVKDIATDPGYANPYNLFVLGNKLFFTTTSAIGSALWCSEGGHITRVNLIPGLGSVGFESSLYTDFADVNGTFYFVRNNTELWKSDGTVAGTVIVKKLQNSRILAAKQTAIKNKSSREGGGYYNFPDGSNTTVVNGILYFSLNGQLWKSDGTDAGTLPVEYTSETAYNVKNLINVNGTLFFTGYYNGGYTLWKSNGNSTGLVQDQSSSIIINNLGYLSNGEGILYFVGVDVDGNAFLWNSDGTTEGTKPVQEAASTQIAYDVYDLHYANGILLFGASGLAGTTLWKSDGTSAGTVPVQASGSSNIAYHIDSVTHINNTFYFSGSDLAGNNILWKSDGTSDGTIPVQNSTAAPIAAYPSYLTNVNGTLYFAAQIGELSTILWKSDGTSEGTTPVQGLESPQLARYIHELIAVNNKAFFLAGPTQYQSNLWCSNGTDAGTQVVKSAPADSGPWGLVNVNGTIYFIAADKNSDYLLWKTDGTEAKTLPILDAEGATISIYSGTPAKLNNAIAFWRYIGKHIELWRTDGTPAGTSLIKAFAQGIYVDSNSLTTVNNQVFFSTMDNGAADLWKTDGTPDGTILVKQLSTSNYNLPSSLTAVNNTLFFVYNAPTGGYQIWKSDGTESGTVGLNIPEVSYPYPLINLNNSLVFLSGSTFFKCDGTAEGTTSFSVALDGYISYDSLIAVNNTLYFATNTYDGGTRLWKTDLTELGTSLVKDLGKTNFQSFYEPFNVNGELFFWNAAQSGIELWKSDGTDDGTVLAAQPNIYSPSSIIPINATIYFSAATEAVGQELFKWQLMSPPTIMQPPLDRTICPGSMVSFNVAAVSSNGQMTYQWKKDGTSLTDSATVYGATTGALTLMSTTETDTGHYTVDVTDAGGTTASIPATLVVNSTAAQAVSITQQPASQTTEAGQTVTFTSAANNTSTTRWQMRTGGSNFWTLIPGATSQTLTFRAALSQDGNVYRAVYSNCGSSVYSNEATLTVNGSNNGAANTLGLVIRELRLRGNSSQPELDEYVEVMNSTNNTIVVNTTDGSAGWALAALSADGNSSTILATIPNGTIILPKDHFLFANTSTNGYSLSTLPDLAFSTDIADDSGVALFNTGNPFNFNTNTVIDAVGWQTTGVLSNLFREGTGLPMLGTNNGEYAWVRQMQNSLPVDSTNNASDFILVSTTGAPINAVTSQLGAPNPAAWHGTIERNAQMGSGLFDQFAAGNASPNQVRDLNPITNGTFGSLSLRRSFTNNTGNPVKKLRFRVIDITNASNETNAELRLLSSLSATINGVPVQGLSLEAPTQPNGGGINSTLLTGSISAATPLAQGAAINVEFKLGVMRKGPYRFIINIEVLQ